MNATAPPSHGQPNHKCIPFTHYIVAKTIKAVTVTQLETGVIKAGGGGKEKDSGSGKLSLEVEQNSNIHFHH